MGGSLALLVLLASAACAGSEPGVAPPQDLTAELTAWLAPDTVRSVAVADGVSYRYLWSARGPWAVHVVEADLSRCELGLGLLVAGDPEGGPGGEGANALVSVTELVERGDPSVLVAVNGDFFTPEGLPIGTELAGGRFGRVRRRPALAWRPGEPPWIGTAEPEDGGLRAGWLLPTDAPPDDVLVVGGFPELLDQGQALPIDDEGGFAGSRTSRTAVAVARDGSRLWILVVDGRQGAYSLGMTLAEVTGLAGALGASEALNLDGGGSSVMVVAGRRVSRPSDEGGERPVANALTLRRDPALCGAAGAP